MRTLKFLFLTWLMALCLSLPTTAAGYRHSGTQTADSVTAVSDTTDSDEDLLDTAATTTAFDEDDADEDDDFLWDMTKLRSHSRWLENLADWAAFGVGGMAIIFVILLLLSPILLIILIVWLIVRSGRRKPVVQRRVYSSRQTATNDESSQPNPTEAPRDMPRRPYNRTAGVEQKKDRATLHIALGVGIVIFFLIVYSRTFIAVGALLACYGVGEYINARREERRNNERNE